jgi:hypothetical protein
MINELVSQWFENKHKLEHYFKTNKQKEYLDYKQIVIKIFELCITKADEYNGFNLDKIHVIDDEDYQGTRIFIIAKDIINPSIKDYIMTNTFYGSCNDCDTLKRILTYSNELPNDEQVKKLMSVSLHLVQKLKWLD